MLSAHFKSIACAIGTWEMYCIFTRITRAGVLLVSCVQHATVSV